MLADISAVISMPGSYLQRYTAKTTATNCRVKSRFYFILVIFLFCLTYTFFQLLDKLWSQVSSLLPPGTCLQFSSRIPTARRF